MRRAMAQSQDALLRQARQPRMRDPSIRIGLHSRLYRRCVRRAAEQDTRAACAPRSLHSVEGFLENFEIAGVANLFARILNPLLLQ